MATPPVVNLDQIFCQEHGDDVLRLGWHPRYERWMQGEPSCEDCRAKALSLVSPAGELRIVPWLGVPQAMSAEQVAGHEAAHAVVGRHRNVALTSAWVGGDDVALADGGSIARGGGVDFEPFSGPLEDYAAFAHAGWAADRLWLKAQGLEGNRACRLAAARGAGIDMNSLAEQDAGVAVHLNAKWDADELVGEHEREIRAVQAELIRHQHLGAEAITAAMDLAYRRSPSSTSKPKTGGETTGMPQTAPSPVGAGTSTASSSGGNSMGIDEITAAIGNAQQASEQIRAALAQVQQLSEDTTGQLGAVLQGSSQPEIQQSLAAFSQVTEQATEIHQLVAGAVDGLESYRNRL